MWSRKSSPSGHPGRNLGGRVAGIGPWLARGSTCGLVALAGGLATASVVAPLARVGGWQQTAGWLYALLSYVCHQMPARSLWLLGAPMGMCSRSFALAVSFAAGGLVMGSRRRPLAWSTSVVLVLPMLVDVATQEAGSRESTNLLRLLTGTLAGVGLAGVVGRRTAGRAIPDLLAKARVSLAVPWGRRVAALLTVALFGASSPSAPVRAQTGAVTLPDERTCEAFAKAVVEATPARETLGQDAAAGLGAGVAADPRICLIAPIVLPVEGVRVAVKNVRGQRRIYQQALEDCREPSRLAERLGLDHLDVAESLHTLANRFGTIQARHADAERLYQRVLVIREQRQGAEHPDVASTLEDYARVLSRAGRETEAASLEARAKAIRARQTE